MHTTRPLVTWLGLTFDLSIILTSSISSLFVLFFVILTTKKLATNSPGKWQNTLEWVVELIQGIMKMTIGRENNVFILTTGITLFLYILISNLLGIPFSIILGTENLTWWKSPTADAHIPMTLSIMIIVYTHFIDIKNHGWKHYLTGYFKPFKALFLINILEQFCTTLTLGLRLFGNIYAGEIMLAILAGASQNSWLTALLLALPMLIWQGFCLFIGAIQSYIFVTLTMVYIAHRITD